MISDLIIQSQSGNVDATMKLINKFNPLLKKYSYKLFYEDAYDDLLVDFIELIHKLKLVNMRNKGDEYIVSYIIRSVYDSYVKKSINMKKFQNTIAFSELNDGELYYIEASLATFDIYYKYELPATFKTITKSELLVINMIYKLGYTVKEIANYLGITRQAVNQMKKRALKKFSIY